MMESNSLAGLKVLVTRPLQQQVSLCEAIEERGGSAVSLPLIEINPVKQEDEIQDIRNIVENLDEFHVLIFVSTNAVRCAADWIDEYWPQFPADIEVIAVGPATARAVSTLLDCNVIHSESGMSSEDVLAMSELGEVDGKRIGIVRGRGGRELLATTLSDRGAVVTYLEVYQRMPIDYEAEDIRQLIQAKGVNVLTITSNEALNSLVKIAGNNKDELSLIPLIVPSTRIAEQAEQNGFSSVINANGADESAFIAALQGLAEQADRADNQ